MTRLPINLTRFCLIILCIQFLCSCSSTPSIKLTPLQKKNEELAENQKYYWHWEYPKREVMFGQLFDSFESVYESGEIPINSQLILMYFGKPDKLFKNNGALMFVYQVPYYKATILIFLKDNKMEALSFEDNKKSQLEVIFNNKNNIPVTDSELDKMMSEGKRKYKAEPSASGDHVPRPPVP